jgi:hypothetical protein
MFSRDLGERGSYKDNTSSKSQSLCQRKTVMVWMQNSDSCMLSLKGHRCVEKFQKLKDFVRSLQGRGGLNG